MVDPQTRTVSVLAQAENPDGLLKLGMFVQITLDSSSSEQVLTVPAKAVVEIEAEKYVFVPAGKARRSRELHASTGRGRPRVRRPRRNQVRLDRGDQVVTSGAFLLKSELILQNEPEEE